MIFKQCAAKKRSLSYVLGDPITREGVIIDPSPDLIAPALSFLAGRGMSLRYVLLTHFPDPALEATLQRLRPMGPRVVAHESTEYQGVDMRLRDNDIIYFGEETIRVLHTPGQMPCAVTYWWGDRLFTGETLLATGPGVCRQGGNIAQQWRSINDKLLIFPDEYLVFPGRESRKRRVACIAEFRSALQRKSVRSGNPFQKAGPQDHIDPASPAKNPTHNDSCSLVGA